VTEFRGPTATRLRNFVREVQDGKCILCPLPITNIHHIQPWRKFPELLLDLKNMVGACRSHHLLLESMPYDQQHQLIVETRCQQ
jgi:hypothetical protein